jgi:tetratricopeptide (TPR) repeat protein
MMKRWACALLMALVLAACVAHEKVGDKAAAVGDWETALNAYGQALADDPNKPELKEKYERAKREAIADAYKKAQACASAGDWKCAVGEADFALKVDGGNSEIAAFRANAARSLALQQIGESHQVATQGKFRVALDMIDRAKVLSSDPAVVQEAATARTGLAAMADAEAERLRQNKSYPEAVEALTVAVSIDGSKRGKLDALQREYEAFRTAEYERLARDGDMALARMDWAAAENSYVAALKMKPGGRAEPLARYAGGVSAAETALSRRDYFNAANAYRQAVESGQDTSGYATSQLALVEVRPYAVRIRSVLARPIRPDGRPWAGNMNPYMTRLLGMFTTEFAGGRGARRLVEAAMSIPPENRPNLSVRVALPDGTQLTTPAIHGLYVNYDSEFIVATNAFDERRLSLRVVHGNAQFFEDVGVVEFPLGEIVRRQEAHLNGGSVAAMDLTIEPAPGRYDGMFANMFPLSDGSNLAPDYSMPTARATGYRLRGVRAVVQPLDLSAAEPDEGAGELMVEIVQGGRVVYRSPQLDNLFEAQWAISNVNLYVQPGEQLRIMVWDVDAGDRDIIVDAMVPGEQFANGQVVVSTPNGSNAILQFESRQVWAGGITH